MTTHVRKISTSGHIPNDWHKHILIIWQEDDAARAAHDDAREQLGPSSSRDGDHYAGAWVRITGTRWEQPPLRRHDAGDAMYYIFPGGWVRVDSYDGSALGIALEAVT